MRPECKLWAESLSTGAGAYGFRAKGTLSFVFFSSLRFLNFGCAGSLLLHVGFFSGCNERGLLFVVVVGRLAVVSLIAENMLEVHRSVVLVRHVGSSWTRDPTSIAK